MRSAEWPIGVSWIWPEDGGLMTSAQLERFHEANVTYVETGVEWLWRAPEYKANPERLKSVIGAFQNAGITVWSVHVPGGETIDLSHPDYADRGIDIITRQMDVCARMGVDKVVVHPSFEPIEAMNRPDRLACCAESIRKLHRPDVRIAIENLPRTCLCNTAPEMQTLLHSLHGTAWACVDVNHSHQGKISDMLQGVADQLITVHISDDDGVDEKHWYPGEGVLSWPDILNTLADIGYAGCLMYELGERFADPMKVRRNYDGLVARMR